MNDNYDDIIELPHQVSTKRPKMTMQQRAAQFAPFAALDGHEEAVADTARKNMATFEIKENNDVDTCQSQPNSTSIPPKTNLLSQKTGHGTQKAQNDTIFPQKNNVIPTI